MIARILLPTPTSDRPAFSISTFAKQFQAIVNDGKVGAPQKIDGKASIPVSSSLVTPGFSSKGVSWNFEQIMQSSSHWAVDGDSIAAHSSQLVFRISGTDEAVRQARWLTVAVLVALEQCPTAIGVYWETAGQVIPTVAFQAAASDPNDWPSIWVSISCQAKWRGAVGFTRGMAAFGQREMETQNASEPPEELFGRFYGLVGYLLEKGPIVKDRETFGQTANEKITVLYADKSSFGVPGPVMNLDYGGSEVIKPTPVKPKGNAIAPERMAVPSFKSAKKAGGKLPLLVGLGVGALLVVGGIGWLATSWLGGRAPVDGGALIATLQGSGDAEVRLKAAERLVGSGEQLFFGNTTKSMEFAGSYGRLLAAEQKPLADSKELDAEIGYERPEIYAEAQGDSLALILDFPGFSSAKASDQNKLKEIAWRLAAEEADGFSFASLAVAIRDGDEYCSVQTGLINGEVQAPGKPNDGAESLVAFFEKGSPSSFVAKRVNNRSNVRANVDSNPSGGRGVVDRSPGGNPFADNDSTADNANGLKFKLNQGRTFRWRGELVSETEKGKLHADLHLTLKPAGRAGLNVGGTMGVHVTSQDETQIGTVEHVFFEGSQDVNSSGQVGRYRAVGHIPLLAQPAGLLPFIELPAGSVRNEWEKENDVAIKTVLTRGLASQAPYIETRIEYEGNTEGVPGFPGSGFGGQAKGREPGGMGGLAPGGLGMGDGTMDRVLHSVEAKELRKYKILGQSGARTTIECTYSLTSEKSEKTQHKIEYVGKFVFDKASGMVVSIELEGDVSHTSRELNVIAPFSLTLNRSTDDDERALAQKREDRKKQRDRDQAKRNEKNRQRDFERELESEKKRDAEMKKADPKYVVQRLGSNDEKVVRDVVHQLTYDDDIEPPNKEIGLAVVKLLVNNPTEVRLSSRTVKRWVSKEVGPQLLESLPDILDSPMFLACVDHLKELEVEGVPERLIVCLGVDETRTWASHQLNRYDDEIEVLFFDTLDDSDDTVVLKLVVRWLTMNGTRKSLARLKRLSKRTNDRTLTSSCESVVRIIEMKGRSGRRRNGRGR